MQTTPNTPGDPGSSSIAIIGMACEFPGAHSPEELWQNVLAGRRFFRRAPEERLPREYFDSDPLTPGKAYCDQVAVLEGWRFDPVEFRIPPVAFHASDMAHWLALDTARAALRDSGLNLKDIDRARIGVVLGNTLAGEFSRSHNLKYRWPYVERAVRRVLERGGLAGPQLHNLIAAIRESYESPLPEITEDSLAGNMANTIAGRICGHFDLGAGGYTVDGACSSSLLSVAHACNALVNGDMDCALAGGVDISLDPFEVVGFAKAQAVARDDIRPYDQHAAGMLVGEGCGLFVLMRERDARARGHRIRAILRGWGISSDGVGGITSPEIEGQMRALRTAYERAGYPMSSVGLIEGHGTGTSLGDKVEITAILRLLDAEPRNGDCRIGSIKSQIGHCKAAAGAAGLVKAVMALERKVLPPTVNCERPNPAFGTPLDRLRPSISGKAWDAKGPRRASVSSMGFGGANSHVTLEEASPGGTAHAEDLELLGSAQSSEVILLSAATLERLQQRIVHLIPLAERICRAELTDLSAALARQPPAGEFRVAIVAESPWHLADSLRAVLERLAQSSDLSAADAPADGIIAGTSRTNPALVALFPGQGSQRLNMGEHLLRRFPFTRELYSQVGDELSARIFRDIFAADDAAQRQWNSELRDTRTAQPAIVLSSVAMLRVLEFLGLTPTVSVGHSLGEISALHAAGAFDAATAVRIASLRARAMSSLHTPDPGAMLAISANPADVEPLAAPFAPSLIVSNYNSSRQTVVSGATASVEKLRDLCGARNIPCRQIAVSHAFHSDIVAPAAATLRDALESIPLQRLTGRLVSTATGEEIAADADLKHLVSRQISSPVRFLDAVRTASGVDPALWIEVGPGSVLTSFVHDILGTDGVYCLPTEKADEDGFHLLNHVVARAFVLGFPVATDRLFAHRFHRPFDVENYNPVFIVNPCERPVQLTAHVEPLALPGTGDNAFLREFATLYQRHHAGNPASAGPGRPRTKRPAAEAEAGTVRVTTSDSESKTAGDKDALITFATDWIAKRTGFPQSALEPHKKFRDDLNLDSIKVGELLIHLSRKAGKTLNGDLAGLANATLLQVVERLLREGAHTQPVDVKTDDTRAIQFDVLPALGEWVRTFRMAPGPAPIESETAHPLPGSGTAVILAPDDSPHALAIADALRRKGLSPLMANSDDLTRRAAPRDLAALLLVLPDGNQTFLTCTPTQFDERIEGMASRLFHVFRWALASRSADEPPLNGLVMRPAHDRRDDSADLDAGAGFLKSVLLEHPNAHFKWVSLPADLSPNEWAEAALIEMEHSGRMAVAYAHDGRRMADAAVPVPSSHADLDSAGSSMGDPLALGPEDVVLVSGGGKGITFELACELARATQCKLALLGTSPLPASNGDSHDLLHNLERLNQAGITHAYVQADVTDLEAVRQAVIEAERRLGRITGVLHGAGITQLRLFRDKSLDDFLRCIRIKARGLYNLLAAVPPARLKMLHVTSSVLGKTGMRGQTDYTFANAWLDQAVRGVKSAYPHVHCLSLGYSVWAETGLGKKIGALESLRAVGVTPVSVREGVSAYRRLLDAPQDGSDFVITGRLTSDLEANLYPHPRSARGRFLESVRRRIPGTEIVADANLSHAIDWYLPEHVFEGTPILPGVMAIEAMVQAAMVCAGRNDLPVLRNIHFRRPLIVPEDGTVAIRTLALAEPAEDRTLCVRVAIRSNEGNVQHTHFEAECWFGLPDPTPESLPVCPALPVPLEQHPETFHPVPLFQGKFFRRIAAIRKMSPNVESITDLVVPDGEHYYSAACDPLVVTGSPALRDACLQTGALILPQGCLPERIGELRFFNKPTPSATVHCHVTSVARSAGGYEAECAVFDADGTPLERMRGLVLQAPNRAPRPPARKSVAPIPMARVAGELSKILPEFPHGLALVAHSELIDVDSVMELTRADIQAVRDKVPEVRHASALANLVATRRAAWGLARRHRDTSFAPSQISLTNLKNGKPQLKCNDASLEAAFAGMDLTLTDGDGVSVAVVGGGPLGVDWEAVEPRDAEQWRGLLGDEGYSLALLITARYFEPFDVAATRVWTLLECGKKTNSLPRSLPALSDSLGGTWLSFVDALSGTRVVSAVVTDIARREAVLSLACKPGLGRISETSVTSLSNARQ